MQESKNHLECHSAIIIHCELLHYNIDIVGITKSKLLEKEFIEDKNNAFFCKGHEINLALQHYVGLAIKNTHLQQ